MCKTGTHRPGVYQRIWLIRHAQAAPHQADDAARVLTVKGQQQAYALAQSLGAQISGQSLLCVSPAQRCQQSGLELFRQLDTAQILSELTLLKERDYVQTLKHMLLGAYSTCRPEQEVLILGHAPALRRSLSLLLGIPYYGPWPCASALQICLYLDETSPTGARCELGKFESFMGPLRQRFVQAMIELTCGLSQKTLPGLSSDLLTQRDRFFTEWSAHARMG